MSLARSGYRWLVPRFFVTGFFVTGFFVTGFFVTGFFVIGFFVIGFFVIGVLAIGSNQPVFSAGPYDRPTGDPHQSRSTVIATQGMVATSHPLAAAVGVDILKAGGNAVDAAIATNAMLGLVEPMSCGIGGDLFVIYWDAKTKRLFGLNASGRSPYAINRQLFAERGLERGDLGLEIADGDDLGAGGLVDGVVDLVEGGLLRLLLPEEALHRRRARGTQRDELRLALDGS